MFHFSPRALMDMSPFLGTTHILIQWALKSCPLYKHVQIFISLNGMFTWIFGISCLMWKYVWLNVRRCTWLCCAVELNIEGCTKEIFWFLRAHPVLELQLSSFSRAASYVACKSLNWEQLSHYGQVNVCQLTLTRGSILDTLSNDERYLTLPQQHKRSWGGDFHMRGQLSHHPHPPPREPIVQQHASVHTTQAKVSLPRLLGYF